MTNKKAFFQKMFYGRKAFVHEIDVLISAFFLIIFFVFLISLSFNFLDGKIDEQKNTDLLLKTIRITDSFLKTSENQSSLGMASSDLLTRTIKDNYLTQRNIDLKTPFETLDLSFLSIEGVSLDLLTPLFSFKAGLQSDNCIFLERIALVNKIKTKIIFTACD